ncbi:PREDICTED: olfactory receptor 49-like [Galeopterus variegatus]|uniref:Olfactory receptor 49-like n=1 Tax=Galeopterus variegatus TaxID=482537 RepID=A0ABM0SEX2_GALVR|nr:PREDICTED: olfactory receptor 49-like [Galeopterus variegatus]
MGNCTTITEFVLLGLSDACELQMLIFLGLLLTYLFTLLGNLLIVVITLMDRRLHTPMYYFLRNFAILEIWFTSVIFPKMLTNILTGYKTISRAGCFLQNFLYFFLGTTEFFLLAVMSFDRYVAICNPLRYATIMSKRICVQLVLCSWLAGFLLIIIPSFIIIQQPFCGPNIINHFFCKGGQGEDKSKIVALLNTIVTPMLNPFIYTLRNKQVKQVFREQPQLATLLLSMNSSVQQATSTVAVTTAMVTCCFCSSHGIAVAMVDYLCGNSGFSVLFT